MPVASTWFESIPADEGVTGFTEPHVNPFIRANSWHVRGRDRDLLVDTGLGVTPFRPVLRDLLTQPVLAVATHTHFDHVGGLHEFDERAVHLSEADNLARPVDQATLLSLDLGQEFCDEMAALGYELDEMLIDARPDERFDPAAFRTVPTTPTRTLDDGDLVDLGDRVFEVLHLPGHSPGSVGLWEESTGILFSGDAVYRDPPLLDELPGSNILDYLSTMRRLEQLPVRVVHGGHGSSFGREHLLHVIEDYRRFREDVGGTGKGKG